MTAAAKPRITLRRIAEEAGVSISTASRALSGAAGISDSLRGRIRSTAERLDWSGSAAAGMAVTVLSKIDTGATGSPEFQQELLAGIETACAELGLVPSVRLLTAESDVTVTTGRHGYVLLSVDDDALIAALAGAGAAAVIVNGVDPLLRLDTAAAANRSGGYVGARHLLALGHRRILRLVHSGRRPVVDRFLGAAEARAEAGLPPDPQRDVELDAMRTDTAYAAVRARLAGRDFTAIQCCNDAAALGAMTAAMEAGLRIPQDLSILGFDDIPGAALAACPLTTLSVPRHTIGAAGLRLLLARIRQPDAPVTCTEFAVPLVQRASTGPAPN